MHYEPQISCRGEWGDVTIVEDNKGRFNHYCQYCGYHCRSLETIKEHVVVCIEHYATLQEDIDYVLCKICNFHAQNLGIHLAHIHKMKSDEYVLRYGGRILTTVSEDNYSKSANKNGSWIIKAKAEGKDLTAIFEKMGKNVSASIMNNDAERKRRSEYMTSLNLIHKDDPEFKKLLSDTAKKTSARPEIQANRAANLERWRKENPEVFYEQCTKNLLAGFLKWKEENPEEFYEKCVKTLTTNYQSAPEKKLFAFVSLLEGFAFKRNGSIISPIIRNKTNRKQIDMVDKRKNIYIEFDGIVHFQPIFGNDALIEKRKRDNEAELVVTRNNWLMIRVSYDRYITKCKAENSFFRPECLDELVKILNTETSGIYKIGKLYGQH